MEPEAQSRDPISEIDSSLDVLGSLLTILIQDMPDESIRESLFAAKHQTIEARKQLHGIDRDSLGRVRAAGNITVFCH